MQRINVVEARARTQLPTLARTNIARSDARLPGRVVEVEPPPLPVTGGVLLLEDGSVLVLETGEPLLTE